MALGIPLAMLKDLTNKDTVSFLNALLMDIDSRAINAKKVSYDTLNANGYIGSTEGTLAAGDDTRIPTQDENDALVGYNGGTYPPNAGNPYVTIDSLPSSGNYKAGTITRTTVQGAGANVAYTGIGFQSKKIMFIMKQHHTDLSIGWTTGASGQVSVSILLNADGSIVNPISTTYIADLGYTLGAGWRVSLVSLDADGFTLTYEVSGAIDSCEIMFIAEN